MALRDIIIIPDKRLRQVSAKVDKITPEIRALVADMFETMYDAPGIGLAAIQVGVPLRVITMDIAKKDDEKAPRAFINAEIIGRSEDKAIYEEGCLSIPDVHEDVERRPRCGFATRTSREKCMKKTPRGFTPPASSMKSIT